MNFRITTDYILQIFNDTTQGYHSIWVGGDNGNNCIESSIDPDTTSEVLNWDYKRNQIPSPSKGQQETSNYRINEAQALQLLNPKTKEYHTINIVNKKSKISFNVGIGEK